VIVVDASVVVSVVGDDEAAGKHARARIAGEDLCAPHLVDLEVTAALRGRVRRGDLSEGRGLLAVHDLMDLEVTRIPHHPQLGRVWELRDNLTPYDAIYVALAELLDITLLTADRRLANAPGIPCDVEVVATPA
jgi:predicted nucleic acid-binding protein